MKIALSLLPLLVLSTACTMSEIEPDADVQLHGTAHNEWGEPLEGHRVALTKEPDIGEVLSGIIWGPVTILACLGDAPPPICEGSRFGSTNALGQFTFSMKGSDTQGVVGQASMFTAVASLPASLGQAQGPTTYQRFSIQNEQMHLPPLLLWTTELEISTSAQELGVSLSGSETLEYSLRFEVANAVGATVWEVAEYSESSLDRRIFEDQDVRVMAVMRRQQEADGVAVEMVSHSSTYRIPGNGLSPLSRGVACSILDADGTLQPQEPCSLTDGNLATPFPLLEHDCDFETEDCADSPVNSQAVVDLGETVSAETLVLRLGQNETDVAYSADGESWIEARQRAQGFVQVTLPQASPIRFVRLTSGRYLGSLAGLSEVSVW